MTELSAASLRSMRWTVTLAASLGWFFDAYVITIYALTVPLIAALCRKSPLLSAWI